MFHRPTIGANRRGKGANLRALRSLSATSMVWDQNCRSRSQRPHVRFHSVFARTRALRRHVQFRSVFARIRALRRHVQFQIRAHPALVRFTLFTMTLSVIHSRRQLSRVSQQGSCVLCVMVLGMAAPPVAKPQPKPQLKVEASPIPEVAHAIPFDAQRVVLPLQHAAPMVLSHPSHSGHTPIATAPIPVSSIYPRAFLHKVIGEFPALHLSSNGVDQVKLAFLAALHLPGGRAVFPENAEFATTVIINRRNTAALKVSSSIRFLEALS